MGGGKRRVVPHDNRACWNQNITLHIIVGNWLISHWTLLYNSGLISPAFVDKFPSCRFLSTVPILLNSSKFDYGKIICHKIMSSGAEFYTSTLNRNPVGSLNSVINKLCHHCWAPKEAIPHPHPSLYSSCTLTVISSTLAFLNHWKSPSFDLVPAL